MTSWHLSFFFHTIGEFMKLLSALTCSLLILIIMTKWITGLSLFVGLVCVQYILFTPYLSTMSADWNYLIQEVFDNFVDVLKTRDVDRFLQLNCHLSNTIILFVSPRTLVSFSYFSTSKSYKSADNVYLRKSVRWLLQSSFISGTRFHVVSAWITFVFWKILLSIFFQASALQHSWSSY